MKITPHPPQGKSLSPEKSQQLPSNSTSEGVSSLRAGLKAGDLLNGRVLSFDARGVAVLDTEIGNISAKSLTSLAVGENVLLEVVKAGAKPDVAISQAKTQVLDLLRVVLPLLKPGQNNIQAMLQSLPEGQKDGNIQEKILQFLSHNSSGKESDPVQQAKLVSLMSNLKSGSPLPKNLQALLGTPDLSILEKASQPELKKLFQLFEAHSAYNSKEAQAAPQSQSSPPQECWLFPCFFADQAGTGEWMFSFDQGASGDQENEYSVVFYLNMSRLGDVHIQLNTKESSIQGVFTLESGEAAKHMQDHIYELQDALNPLFENVHFSFKAAGKKVYETLKADLQKKVGFAKHALIDVTA